MWAAYLKGGFEDFGPEFSGGMTLSQFQEVMASFLMTTNIQWVFTAEGKYPYIGWGCGIHMDEFLWERGIMWFPWATARQKLESMVNFVNEMRNDLTVIGLSDENNKRYLEHVCKYGVMRRVGKIYSRGRELTMFQSRERS